MTILTRYECNIHIYVNVPPQFEVINYILNM